MLVQRNVTQRKHTPCRRRLRRCPLYAPCSAGGPTAHPCAGGPCAASVPRTACARRSARRLQGAPNVNSMAALPPPSAAAGSVLLPFRVPFGRTEQRSVHSGSAGQGRPAERCRDRMSRQRDPEHVSSAGHPRSGGGRRVCFLFGLIYLTNPSGLGRMAPLE